MISPKQLWFCFLFFPFRLLAQEYEGPDDIGLQPPAVLHCSAVKDQSMSSTCWSFSSVSFLESEMMRKKIPVVDLSEMFVARYSYLRKIEHFLDARGQIFFTPGGQFHDLAWVLNNYGIVPEQVYTGRVHGEKNHDHARLDTVMAHFVHDLLDRGVRTLSAAQRAYADSVLDYYLGAVPRTFLWKGQRYTPKSFLQKVVRLNMNDYAEVTSYSHHPYNSWFALEDKYNWTGDDYYNIPFDEFRLLPQKLLAAGVTLGWDGDADDPDFHYFNALAYLPDSVVVTKETRQAAFETQETLLDHMMQVVSVAQDKYGKTWYYIKNSWGKTNQAGGFLWMREDYFLMRTVAVIVPKTWVMKR